MTADNRLGKGTDQIGKLSTNELNKKSAKQTVGVEDLMSGQREAVIILRGER